MTLYGNESLALIINNLYIKKLLLKTLFITNKSNTH